VLRHRGVMVYKGEMRWSRRTSPNAPETMQLPVVSAPSPDTPRLSSTDRLEVQRVLDLALGIGAAQLASGVGAVDVTSSMRGVLEVFGVRRCQVDVTYDRITVSYRAWVGADPLTAMHRVPSRSLDYSRLKAVDRLIQRIAAGTIDRSAANTELDQIVHAPHPYPRWVATAALAAVGAGMAVLLGGGPLVACVAAMATATIDRIGRVLNRHGVLLFFQQIVGAAVATSVTVVLTALDLVAGKNPSLVAAASIVVLLSGMAVVGAVQDMLTGYYLTGVARGVEIALFSVGLLVGVTIALRVALAFGVDVTIAPDIVAPGLLSVPVRVVAGGVVAAAVALASYAPLRGIVAAGMAGAAGSAVLLLLSYAGFGLIESSFVAATLIGLAGAVLSRRFRLPPLIVAMAGIIPLVPGLTTYRGFVSLVTGDAVGGLSSLSAAFATALALGAGVLCGQFLSDPVRRRMGRLQRRYFRQGTSGLEDR
jgi:uncharacterized membrane protein YjjP (DUF1212 family)